ncbi:MAG: hypothetical protein V7K48_01130 [Nostoc sp.]|uniref:hypothetical protein n=1 Tax=Nostoc sp. TaxID=1180 RepID=UPI002FFC9A2D
MPGLGCAYALSLKWENLKGAMPTAGYAYALSGNPPQEIAQELKDLFIKINLHPYFERHGLSFDEEKLRNLIIDKHGS